MNKLFKIILIVLLLLTSGAIKSQVVLKQTSDEINTEGNKPHVYFVGFDTGSSANFLDILETLNNTKGINVLSYCEKNNIIKLTFNKDIFKELDSVFKMVENNYREVICYNMKHYTNESYNEMCHSELAKRNIGGTEQ